MRTVATEKKLPRGFYWRASAYNGASHIVRVVVGADATVALCGRARLGHEPTRDPECVQSVCGKCRAALKAERRVTA